MSERQLFAMNSRRHRPLRTAAILAASTVAVLAFGALRRNALRQEALQAWTQRTSVIARLTGTSATGWVAGRRSDARLLAIDAGRSPQLFGVRARSKAAVTPENLSFSLARGLSTLNQLRGYTAIWLFDTTGKVVGTTSTTPPSQTVRAAAIRSLSLDSGTIAGPSPVRSGHSQMVVAERVVLESAIAELKTPRARVIGAVVLTSDAAPLLTELAGWSDRSPGDDVSLVVAGNDSLYEFALAPNGLRGTQLGAWKKSAAPAYAQTAIERGDSTARLAGSRAEFAARLGALPWAFVRRQTTDSVFAGVDARLGSECSSAFAVIFMIVIIVIARKQTERELQLKTVAESEVRYRLLADNATDVILRHEPDGRIVYASPAVSAILGYVPRQLEGRYPAELANERDGASMENVLAELLTMQDGSRLEHRMRHADGHYVWLETTGRAVRDPVWNKVTEIVTVSRDIGERKKTEEALRASEEEYRVLFDANPVPMWAFDADSYKFVAVNDAAVEHYGYTRDEFLALTIFDIRPPQDVAPGRRSVEHLGAGFKELHGSRHQKKDGTIIDVDLTVHQVRLSGRVSWLVLVKDITEALRTANALRASNEFVRALFDSSPVAIIATDLDLRVVQWNGAAQRLFGWTQREIIGQPYPLASDAMLPEVTRNKERAMRDGCFTDMHVQRLRKDGTPVDLSLSVGVMRNAEMQANGFVMLAADLTERARLEAQLRHAQKMDAVGQMAGGIAHDFNNLLTVVTGYAGLLLAEMVPENPIRDDIEEIKGAADRAAVLTRQLLAFSRQQQLEPRILDLNTVVRDMEQMVRRVLPTDIKMSTSLDPELGAVNADPGQLEQVLMNLIVNARDAMPSGGTLTIETMPFTLHASEAMLRAETPAGDYVVLAVSDTGCGMTKAVQARIFEPFFTTKDRGKGTGLGLSTAHGIVTQSGGFLTVYSEPGLGSSFRVCLPLVEREVVAPSITVPSPAVAQGAEVILLVEDDAPVRVATTRMLERAGYTVIPAINGREALGIHQERGSEINLIVTDMIMPEMNGRELVARVRQRDPNAAVLVMSGYTEQTSRSENFLDSGTLFIQKPFTPEGLTTKVRSAINTTTEVASRF